MATMLNKNSLNLQERLQQALNQRLRQQKSFKDKAKPAILIEQPKEDETVTFFCMGMDVPIKESLAIKSMNRSSRMNMSSRNSCNESPQQSEVRVKPDFSTKLDAMNEKIKAFKDYFYDKDVPFLVPSRKPSMMLLDSEETERKPS